MTDPERRIVEFERLNWLGKAVYVTGNVSRLVEGLLDFVVDRTASLIGDAERAFREALDDTVEDAKILDEESGPDGR
jgi:hypothetical protein